MKGWIFFGTSLLALLHVSASAQEPCMGEVFYPAKLESKVEKVLVKEVEEVLETRPATHKWVDEKILIREAYTRLEVVPAVFEKRESRVMVSPPAARTGPVPAVYTNQVLTIEIAPAHKSFVAGEGIVSVPAQSTTATQRILVKPAGRRVLDCPAEYKTVTQEVMVAAAKVREVKIPAKFDTRRVRRVVTPAAERLTIKPAVYKNVETQVVVAKSHTKRVPILCEAERTPERILTLQQALKTAGHDPGKLDGRFHPRTEAALDTYQHKKGLGIGALSLETLKRLDIPIVLDSKLK